MPTDEYDFEGRAHCHGDRIVLDFGKHMGDHLDEVPTGYLGWMEQQNFPADLLVVVSEERNIR